MDDLEALYQQVILDHSRNPRHYCKDTSVLGDGVQECYNPLCGDKVQLHITEEAGKISKVQFSGAGCALSIASASLMCEALVGRNTQDVVAVMEWFHTRLQADNEEGEQLEPPQGAGKLTLLFSVKRFPMRVKCVTCAWHTLKAALRYNGINVSDNDDSSD